jgi:hypothetical protein
MRWFALLALVLSIAAQASIGPDDARHLLNRAGFGATPHEIAEYARLTRPAAVDRLLAGTRKTAATLGPDWVKEPITPPRVLRNASQEERRAFQAQEIRRGFDLRTWWIDEMLGTPSPLTERMTLFWHNHFVSSQQKVRYTRLMYEQNVLLRRRPPAGRGPAGRQPPHRFGARARGVLGDLARLRAEPGAVQQMPGVVGAHRRLGRKRQRKR